MNHEAEKEEIKPLIFNYVFNSILFALILAMHLIIYTWIFWIFSSLAKLFLLGAYLNCINNIITYSIKSKIFCKECPFNLRISHLNAVFEEY